MMLCLFDCFSGSPISLRPLSVFAYGFSQQSDFAVQEPLTQLLLSSTDSSLSIESSIIGPSSFSCENIILLVNNSAVEGREQWIYQWIVQPVNSIEIQQYEATGNQISLSKDWENGLYQITLTVRTSENQTFTNTKFINKADEQSNLIVTVIGDTERTVKREETTSIQLSVTETYCGNVTSNLAHIVHWSLFSSSELISTSSPVYQINPTYIIPSFTLQQNQQYIVRATVQSQYQDFNQTVEIQLSVMQAELIRLQSAKLSNSVARIVLSFSAPAFTFNNSCNYLSPSLTPLLGVNYSCSWLNVTTSQILLGSKHSIFVGIVIGVNFDGQTSTAVLSGPTIRPSVQAVITGPNTIGICDSLTLNGGLSIGNAGQSFNCKWDYQGYNQDIIYFLQSLPSDLWMITIPFELINQLAVDEFHTFSLQVQNWLYDSSEVSFTVYRSSQLLPSLSFAGSSVRYVDVNRDITLSVQASLPTTCDNAYEQQTVIANNQLLYQWTIQPEVQLPFSNNAQLTIPKNTLQAEQGYTITCTVGSKFLTGNNTATVRRKTSTNVVV